MGDCCGLMVQIWFCILGIWIENDVLLWTEPIRKPVFGMYVIGVMGGFW